MKEYNVTSLDILLYSLHVLFGSSIFHSGIILLLRGDLMMGIPGIIIPMGIILLSLKNLLIRRVK